MTGIIHPEEREQVDVLEAYYWDHPDAQYRIVFADGEEYIGIFFAAFESDNAGELEIEMDDPQYDEFFVVAIEIVSIVHDGPRRLNQYLSLDYRDFPKKIIDITNGVVLYPPSPHSPSSTVQ
ncbi:hypothetical protein [Actinotignum schaalii]|uniref:hypothetical protein n=1 Tax=Actinotignum schaalii TaxID=59505 RepID=UPI0003F7F8FB|nr:hypothetical protein [Actinotignum schaalii]WQN44317.1 hypothetical protein U4A90_04740 [Actinotignum schaalii]